MPDTVDSEQGGRLDTVIGLRIDDGRLIGRYAVRNAEKLSYMERETRLSR
ncbi:hypothetical protein OHB26_25450 [Nocardia sp. NBC_01503]|nr:hypothetical protein [Nocardia sp. NBC_01503]WTL30276.1 hypothetical protein OHB26_25450 [Nocardia sp. NBC_01503]